MAKFAYFGLKKITYLAMYCTHEVFPADVGPSSNGLMLLIRELWEVVIINNAKF